MNVVRLCFQCELEGEDGILEQLYPVVSQPIYDKSRSTHTQTQRHAQTDRDTQTLKDTHADLKTCMFMFVHRHTH